MEAISSGALNPSVQWREPTALAMALVISVILHVGLLYFLRRTEVRSSSAKHVKIERDEPFQVIYLGTQEIRARQKPLNKGVNHQ